MRLHPSLAAVLVAAFAGALAAAPAPPAPRSPNHAGWDVLDQAQAQFRAIRADSALVVVEGLLASPGTVRDAELEASARLLKGACLSMLGRPLEAEPLLREAKRSAGAAGNAANEAQAARFLAYSLGQLSRGDESLATYRWLLDFALAHGDSLNEANARLGIAYADLLAGRYAEGAEGYRRAIALYRPHHEGFLLRNALVGLGRCEENLGRVDDARRAYLEVEGLARAAGDPYNRSSALNNLGTLEYQNGDLAAAEAHFRDAYELYRGSPVAEISAATNLALVQIARHRFREAAAVLDTALATARATGSPSQLVHVLNRLAALKTTEDRFPEAIACAREAVSLAPQLPEAERLSAVWALGATLSRARANDEAIRLLESESARITDRSAPAVACGLRLQLASAYLRADRHADALATSHLALENARRAGSADLEFRARGSVALTLLRLGRVDDARQSFEESARLWEGMRSRQRDPEVRERMGHFATACLSGLVATRDGSRAAPRPEDAAAIFETIERFKARTLRERMLGPFGDAPDSAGAPLTLAAFRTSTLREGELFLEPYLSPESNVLVAVTTRGCRVIRLPGGDTLAARARTIRDLAARPGPGAADADFVERAAAGVGGALFAPVAGMLAGATRVVVATDGELGTLPWAALAESEAPAGASALLARRELVLVPSAGVLADLRRRDAGGPAPAGLRLLAVSAEPVEGAPPLEGAEREVRWVAHQYEGARATQGFDAADPGPEGGLESYDVLHFAAHTFLDDEHPWRSGIRLANAAGPGHDGTLRAERIASLRLRARLAVLSSCESAGARAPTGEGVGCLTAAFVSAGVPATIATLWPVGDRATADLMRRFYRRLERGATVAAALRAAQLEVRGRAATRHPFYWAGFVVLGDGDVTVPLRRRPPSLPLAAGAAVAIAVALAAGRRRSPRSAVTKPGERTLT